MGKKAKRKTTHPVWWSEIRLVPDEELSWDALAAHPVLGACSPGAPTAHQELEVGYDASDLALFHNGWRLRLQENDGRWRRLLEGPDRLRDRQKVKKDELDVKQLKKVKGAKRLFKEVPPDSLLPVYVWTRESRAWELVYPEGLHLSVSLEKGDLTRGPGRDALSEVLLHRRTGEPERFLEAALGLMHGFSAGLAGADPGARGLAALDPAILLTPELTPTLDPKASLEEAFVLLGEAGLVDLGNAHRLALYGETGATAMRAATGGLTALLSLFSPAIPPESGSEANAALVWAAREATPLADWERFNDGVLTPFAAHFGHAAGFKELREAAERERMKAIYRLRRAAESYRFARLALGLSHWLTARSWRESLDLKEKRRLGRTLTDVAREGLDSRYDALLRAVEEGAGSGSESGSAWEKSNAALDGLAEAGRLFSSLYADDKRFKVYQRALENLREVLGGLLDLEAARRLFPVIAQGEEGDADPAAPVMAGWLAAREEGLSRRAAEAWRAFIAVSPYWRKGG